MQPLSYLGAAWFVGGFQAGAIPAHVGMANHVTGTYPKAVVLQEGTPQFDQVRTCLLRECDRTLFLSASCFARALESLRASSAYWTAVGLYYSCFFAATAILGMFGCWFKRQRTWIEAVAVTPGGQKLAVRDKKYSKITGSHEAFWDGYYRTVQFLTNYVDPAIAMALVPVANDPAWLAKYRKEVNYEPETAFALMDDFRGAFDATAIPACFPGRFSTELQVAQAFISCARFLAEDLKLVTDAHGRLGSRRDDICGLVTNTAAPELTAFAQGTFPDLEF